MHTFDLSLTEMTKVEGAAALDLKVENNKVTEVKFKITEFKRFYTQAMRGKQIAALPQLLARICGTCSNAHLLCSIEACEKALGITVSEQAQKLRDLTVDALIIRDHALHLYLFSMPDIFGKDAFLDFDENDATQHQMLHDAFTVKGAGDSLARLIAGRSVHAINPTIGGFLKIPTNEEIQPVILKLTESRAAALRLINIFLEAPFHFDRQTHFMALVGDDKYNYLQGKIISDDGTIKEEANFHDHLERVIIPYSQASGYEYQGKSYMVGSLARINLAKEKLNPSTKKDAARALEKFPSTDIYLNNVAQAIEILNSLDNSVELLKNEIWQSEPIIKIIPPKEESIGIGVIEAPRGTLYHKIKVGTDNKIIEGEIVVPTGQNQINIEQDIVTLVENSLDKLEKEQIVTEIEKLIRAYDPCLSCASHFMKVNWR